MAGGGRTCLGVGGGGVLEVKSEGVRGRESEGGEMVKEGVRHCKSFLCMR